MMVTSIFSFFPQCFRPFPRQISIVQLHSFCRLQMLSIWISSCDRYDRGQDL